MDIFVYEHTYNSHIILIYKYDWEGEHMEEISPVEDLMREHGVLHRILLIYESIIVQIKTNAFKFAKYI